MSSPGNNFKPGTLAARWRRNPDGMGPDMVTYYPSPPDGHLLHDALYHGIGVGLVPELERRGYDISTLRFTIRKKALTTRRPEPKEEP